MGRVTVAQRADERVVPRNAPKAEWLSSFDRGTQHRNKALGGRAPIAGRLLDVVASFDDGRHRDHELLSVAHTLAKVGVDLRALTIHAGHADQFAEH